MGYSWGWVSIGTGLEWGIWVAVELGWVGEALKWVLIRVGADCWVGMKGGLEYALNWCRGWLLVGLGWNEAGLESGVGAVLE